MSKSTTPSNLTTTPRIPDAPPCPHCGATNAKPLLYIHQEREDYYRCESCHHVWTQLVLPPPQTLTRSPSP